MEKYNNILGVEIKIGGLGIVIWSQIQIIVAFVRKKKVVIMKKNNRIYSLKIVYSDIIEIILSGNDGMFVKEIFFYKEYQMILGE